MKSRLFKYWDRIRSGFWFLPTVMAAASVVLAFLSVTLDPPLSEWLARNLGWKFRGGAEGASSVLGIIAGSMISITGVVFSMTLVALSLASSQMGPRLLRTFMRDASTQVVLGTFIATFLYCLLVVRTIRHGDEAAFVPHLSVSLGVLLAVASVGVLIYFIHHLSTSIQANEIAARIGRELAQSLERVFPEGVGRGADSADAASADAATGLAIDSDVRPIDAAGDGYLQFIDGEALLTLATGNDLVIRVERKPGNYVVAGSALALVSPASRLTDELARQIRDLFVLGHQRTSEQDIEFGVNQLVEVAVRALSPGLNDPFTAITCVDQLGSFLCRLARREMPSLHRCDEHGQLRLVVHVDTFPDIADAAFNQIRQYGRGSVAVTIRLLETIALVAGFAQREEDRVELLRHADLTARGANEGLSDGEDRRAVEACCRRLFPTVAEASAGN